MSVSLHRDGVEVEIMDGPYLSDGEPTAKAVADYTHLIGQLESLKGFAADGLLDLYNRAWVDEQIGKVDRHRFMARLQKPSVHLYDELGAAMVYFEDGGLFAGHMISIWTEDGQPVGRASLRG